MSRRAPTKEEQDEFWTVLRASLPQWKPVELERLLTYDLRHSATGSEDASAVAQAAFAAFPQASDAQRSDAMARISTTAEFKAAKKALGIRRPKALATPDASQVAAKIKRQRSIKPGPTQEELLAFWALLEGSASHWAEPKGVDNLLAYHLRQPRSEASIASEAMEAHKVGFFAAPADRQREAMASLSTTAEMKAAKAAARSAPGAKARGARA